MRKATILIVEDDAILALNLQMMLSTQGHTVIGTLTSGEEAVAFLVKNEVDLVLMDIELNGAINDDTAAEKIFRTSDIPVVFLTGYSHDLLLEQSKIAAPYGYLIKPVAERELAATIEVALHRHMLDCKRKKSNEWGETEATSISFHDITQTRKMDQQLIQSEKLATLGLLIAGIAHEINNPNNFIFFNTPILRSYLEFLLPIVDEYVKAHPDLQVFNRPYSAFREDCFKLLDNIEHGSIRINQIVGNLKEFVREREKGEFRRIDLKQVVEKALNLCQGRIRKTVKTFEVDIPEGLPALYSDPLAIEQVVVNLLVNAIQALDKDDSWVRLRIIAPDQADGEVMIEVGDNGCGMDVETQRKIFDPFFTTKAAGIGTGLGLSITHRLLEELGGHIEVKSIVGEGSVFLVLLNARATPLKPMKTG